MTNDDNDRYPNRKPTPEQTAGANLGPELLDLDIHLRKHTGVGVAGVLHQVAAQLLGVPAMPKKAPPPPEPEDAAIYRQTGHENANGNT